jgi:hypothetical protein
MQSGAEARSATVAKTGELKLAPPLEITKVTENAFRVLGLPETANSRRVHDAAASLRRGLKLGVQKSTHFDFPWLGPIDRGEGALQNAIGRIGDLERRLQERLFWFSPSAANLGQLEDIDRVISAGGVRGTGPDVEHDRALFILLRATVFDSQFADESRWLAAISAWQRLVASNEGYWTRIVELEQSAGYEPAGNSSDIARLRDRALELALTPFTEAAKEALTSGNETVAICALKILRAAELKPELLFDLENSIVGSLEDGITNLCIEIRDSHVTPLIRDLSKDRKAAVKTNKKLCSDAARRMETEAIPRLETLQRIAGATAIFALRARGVLAAALGNLATSWTWADEWEKSEHVLKRAKELAAGTPIENRFDQELNEVALPAMRQRDKVKSVKHTPPMYTFNTVGTRLYSLGMPYPGDPSVNYGTLYFVILFVPLIPLRRYLVTENSDGSWNFYATVRFGLVQWIHLAVALAVIAGFFIYSGHSN